MGVHGCTGVGMRNCSAGAVLPSAGEPGARSRVARKCSPCTRSAKLLEFFLDGRHWELCSRIYNLNKAEVMPYQVYFYCSAA